MELVILIIIILVGLLFAFVSAKGERAIRSNKIAQGVRGEGKTASMAYGRVERRSVWSGLQFFCGVICIIAGFFLLDNEVTTGIALIVIGVQAFFIGFLINVFTDIRWFLQEINQRMPLLDKVETRDPPTPKTSSSSGVVRVFKD